MVIYVRYSDNQTTRHNFSPLLSIYIQDESVSYCSRGAHQHFFFSVNLVMLNC